MNRQYQERLAFPITKEMKQAVSDYAHDKRMNVSELLRHLIKEALEKHKP